VQREEPFGGSPLSAFPVGSISFYFIFGIDRVTDVKPENGGVYRCQVHSPAGNFEDNYILAIQGKII